MNPQPPEYVGQLFALIFILFFIINFAKVYINKKHIDNDLFVLGYILDDEYGEPINGSSPIVPPKTNPPDDPRDDNPPDDPSPKPKPPRKSKKSKPKKASKPKNLFEMQQIHIDCVNALHSLGVKKREAQTTVKQVFTSSNPPKSIQEFLLIAMSK